MLDGLFDSFIQTYVSPGILGRVTSATRAVGFAMMPVGALLAGVLATALGVRAALWMSVRDDSSMKGIHGERRQQCADGVDGGVFPPFRPGHLTQASCCAKLPGWRGSKPGRQPATLIRPPRCGPPWRNAVQYAFWVLRFEPDSSLADWFARRDEPWGDLVTMGPAGFGSYARVRYLEEDRISQRVLFARLRVHLAGRTKTPGDCFHGLWAGAVSGMHGDPARGISPWFPANVLTGPKVRIPHREYLLFRGHLDELGHWGATDPTTGSSRDGELPAPHLLWPADHRWFAATDVDSDFTWVGGSLDLIDAVSADPKLDAGRVHRH